MHIIRSFPLPRACLKQRLLRGQHRFSAIEHKPSISASHGNSHGNCKFGHFSTMQLTPDSLSYGDGHCGFDDSAIFSSMQIN